MALPPQKFREIVFQLLYSRDFVECDEKETIKLLMESLSVAETQVEKALEKVRLIEEKRTEIDAKITAHSHSYTFERIPRVERNILRVAIFELGDPSIPPKVVLSEAIRLTKKFSTKEGSTFVNAILDAIYQEQLKNG